MMRIKNTEVELIQNDCVGTMRSLTPLSYDVVVTSPPYNLKKKYRSYRDDKTIADYLAWSEEWVGSIASVMRDDGSFFLNVGATSINPNLPFQLLGVVCKTFCLQNTFHWIKSISIDRNGATESYGHFKPINSKRFVNDLHEYVFHFTKEKNVSIDRLSIGVPYTDKSNVNRWQHTGKKDIRCRGNTWFIPYSTITSSTKQRPHPATFPPRLAENCIRIHGKKSARVLDPFVGIGSSAIAAIACDASIFTGIDIDDFYIQESLTRAQKYV